MLGSYTNAQLNAVYKIIYRRCERDLAGGCLFGMDWVILRTVFPRRAQVLRDVVKELWKRK